jgi:hypothetical protein
MPSPESSPPLAPSPAGGAMLGASLDAPKTRLTRRRLILLAAAGSIGLSAELAATAIRRSGRERPAVKPAPDIYQRVVPEKGVATSVMFGDALQKVIAAGALDPEKLRAQGRALPHWVERLLAGPSEEPIFLTRERAPYLVNLLWPIGPSNRAVFNRSSPINTAELAGFASTGGWTLGRAPSGHVYFNAVDAVPLTERQAFLALAVATNTFRPCCDNSTFFQDCNHGSALLGLIELAVSQGATAEAVYRIAATANSYWFPAEYARTAQYFSRFEDRSWKGVSAPLVLAASFSTLSGWKQHVDAPLWRVGLAPPVDPRAKAPVGCAV